MNDFGRRGCPRRFLNQPPPSIIFYGPTSFARSDGLSFVRSLARLVRSRKYTSNGPYGHTVRRISGEACRVHPRHRWAAGPLASLVGGPAGLSEGFTVPLGKGHKGGASLLYPLFASLSPPLLGPPTLAIAAGPTVYTHSFAHRS